MPLARCAQTQHPEASPLVLCDSCPRSYHLSCMGMEWGDLPPGDWACPKCVDRHAAAVRKILDWEVKRSEGATDKCGPSATWCPCGLTGPLPTDMLICACGVTVWNARPGGVHL